MKADAPRPSILQIMKLVALRAGGLASMEPALGLWRAGAASWVGVAVFGAVSAPLAAAVLAFLLYRPAPGRDRLVLAALLAAVASAFGIALRMLALFLASSPRPSSRANWRDGLAILAAVALLGVGVAFLVKRIVGRRGVGSDD